MKMLADNAHMPTLASFAPKHTMTTETLNRRNAERFKLGTALVAVVVGAHGRTAETKGFFEGHAYDVSQDGIRIELDSTLPVGTPVEVEMHMPGMGAMPSMAGQAGAPCTAGGTAYRAGLRRRKRRAIL